MFYGGAGSVCVTAGNISAIGPIGMFIVLALLGLATQLGG
jgi:hypothetical protein